MRDEEILEKYSRRLKKKVQLYDVPNDEVFSREYEIFRNEAMMAKSGFYENAAKKVGNLITIKAKEKDVEKLERDIEMAHLDITVNQAYGFAVFVGALFIILGLFVVILSFVIGSFSFSSLFLALLLIIVGAAVISPLSKLPSYIANRWRLKSSNQMVLCILYIVMYMRHTSNLEHAIKFAAEHVGNPLALDLRKIFWDVETRRHNTIRESLDSYLEKWKDTNQEFVQSFHLIEGSLVEPSEKRRVELLDKALDVMLEGTYDKMLNFAHNLHSPITTLHMLGVILPILGLVMFPLIGSFMGGSIKWYHIMVLYNILLPLMVFFVGLNILTKRPTGYSESYLMDEGMRKDKGLVFVSFFLAFIFIVMGFMPVILHSIGYQDFTFMGGNFLGYQCDGKCGPFGLGSLLMSFLVPLGLALSFGMYYKTRTKGLIEIRKKTKRLEKEFAGSLFQLGNRVGDGIPLELAFEDVAKSLKGTDTGNLFKLVSMNIRRGGMGVKEAIFDSERGALKFFPSAVIEGGMKVLIESAKKGPQVVARSLISVSQYMERIHRVNMRLKDLLAEIISSMKSQISFMAP